MSGRKRPVSVRIKTVSATAPKKVEISAPYDDEGGWEVRLADAFGTASHTFARQQLGFLMDNSQASGPVNEQRVRSMLGAVGGVQPRDELEAMLAVQMATTHAFAMDSLRRAATADNIRQLDANGNMATKMLRTFVLQVEALAKLRRGGEQRVIVQHVNVNEGGQAVVGHVSHQASGGGGTHENLGRPHAPVAPEALAFVPGAPLWSPDQVRDAVQVAEGEGADAMQDARRRHG